MTNGRLTAITAALMTMASFTAHGRESISIRDYTGRGFAPDVVSYTIAINPGDAGKLRLAGPDGAAVPFQVNNPTLVSSGSALALPPGPGQTPRRDTGKAMLSFVTGLPAGTSVVFTLSRDGQGAMAASTLKTSIERDTLIMENSLCAVRLPAPVEKKFAEPVAASTLPAPILAFRSGPKGAWLGSGKVRSDRKVSGWRVKLVADGPVFAESIYELDYEGGGYYRAVVRLADRVPMARVIEEYDLGRMVGDFTLVTQINPAQEDWELNLTANWKPDTYERSKAWGNGGGGDTGVYSPLDEFKAAAIVNAGAYSGNHISGFGLFRAADTNSADYPGIGITPLHNGFWRRAMDLHLVRPAPDQVSLLLPMTRTPPAWVETSPFCVAPHDDEKPYTYARRQWGLLLGPLPSVIPAKYGDTSACRTYQARLTYGNIGLDRYKDFILEWPDTGKSAESDVTKADNDSAIAASRRISRLILSAAGFAAQSHHAASDGYAIATAAGNAIKLPGVSDEMRRLLRAQLALLTYLFVDGDTIGEGSGSHTGNPNMSLARQGWVSASVSQLPDHPMYPAWRDYMAAWTEFKLADNMAPEGGWFEPGNYHEWGYWRLIWGMFGLEAMKAPRMDRILAYHSVDSDFYMNLLTPVDSRYGSRIVPGFGNNGNHHTDMYRDAAIALLKHKPKQADELAWAWQANNPAPVKTPDILAAVKPVEPPLTSRYYPGFGLVFRAHQGPDETYMLFRSGFLWSHWTVDQGNFALYSKGASLIPSQPYAYFTSELLDYSLENDIRFGHPSNEFRFGWPDSNVLDHRFGAKAQYAWASAGYPEWFINPGLSEGWKEAVNFAVGFMPRLDPAIKQEEGAFWWNRQIAFMIGRTPQSPNYFVFHDSITGDGKLAQWFNLDLAGTKSDVQAKANRMTIKTEWPVSLEIEFADNRKLAPSMVEQNQHLNTQGKGSPNWVRKDGTPVDPEKKVKPDSERHVLLRIPADPGSDHFWIAYPKAANEAAPKLERLAPNTVKVTHAEGTDYILLSPSHDRFEGDGVVLEGQAASVRVSSTDITFALMGGAGSVGYKDHILESTTPFERTIAVNALKPGKQSVSNRSAPELPFKPVLKSHEQVAECVTSAKDEGRAEYRVDSDKPLVFKDEEVSIEARKALVLRGSDGVRFIAPEGTFVQLVAGKSAVRGLGPFDITITASNVTGTVAGGTRTIVVSMPEDIIRPMYEMDGVRWYAAYPDDPAPFRGRNEAQFSLAFGVTEGKHSIEVREWESPELPPPVARKRIP